MTKILVSNIFANFLLPFHLAIWASKVSEKIRLDRKIGFQNTFYTKCINVIIDSIGPSIILRSIYLCKMVKSQITGEQDNYNLP